MSDDVTPQHAEACDTVADPRETGDTWRQRFADAIAARQARRERLADWRRQQAVHRAYGLRQRHARKLRRRRGGGS